jgi:Fe-S cluster biogenesis protein NfuA
MSASVIVVPTPNPNALMFKVEEALVHSGTFEGRQGDDLSSLPLAAEILVHEGTELVLIAPRFVTVRKLEDADWMALRPAIVHTLIKFIDSGGMAVVESQSLTQHTPASEVEQRILTLIDEEIRPAIAQDGGDMVYLGFENGVVRVRLIGACGSCPSSMTTLKMGIEALMVEEIPEVLSVEQESAA